MSGGYRSRQPSRPRGLPPELRDAILTRDGHRCRIHGEGCTRVATEVDHTLPWFEGGTDDPANLQSVCAECHAPKTQAEAQRARAKFSRRRPAPRHPLDSLRASLGGDGVGSPSSDDRLHGRHRA